MSNLYFKVYLEQPVMRNNNIFKQERATWNNIFYKQYNLYLTVSYTLCKYMPMFFYMQPWCIISVSVFPKVINII